MFANDGHSILFSYVLWWFCYIDDILLLWAGPPPALDEFMAILSHNDYNLKFTMQSSLITIAYLDITINITTDGLISTSLYWKPTAGTQFCTRKSAHPQPLIQSIPFSQYLRLKRNCSNDLDFKQEADRLYEWLLARGYGKTSLKKAFKKAVVKPRNTILFPEPK